MPDGLFHAKKGLPESIVKMPERRIKPRVSYHARCECERDKYDLIILPDVICFSGSDVFEVEIQGGKLVKFCLRLRYDDNYDCVYVIAVNYTSAGLELVLKTVWKNHKKDEHRSVDLSRYATWPA